MADLSVTTIGRKGVNVDKNPLELGDDELQKAQNAINDPAAGESTIRKRPGLTPFTTSATAGQVLGGIGVPLQQLLTGSHFIYVGRGPIT